MFGIFPGSCTSLDSLLSVFLRVSRHTKDVSNSLSARLAMAISWHCNSFQVRDREVFPAPLPETLVLDDLSPVRHGRSAGSNVGRARMTNPRIVHIEFGYRLRQPPRPDRILRSRFSFPSPFRRVMP